MGNRKESSLHPEATCDQSMKRVDWESFVGTTHRNLTVLSIDGECAVGKRVFPAFLVECICGKRKRMNARSIVYKITMSCGCRTGTRAGKYNKKGTNNPKWRGGSIREKDGRLLIYAPDHPYPNHSGIYVYRYRLAMEAHLGRILEPNEIVHHINGDCTDDCLENLTLTNKSDHGRFHRVPEHRRFVGLKRPPSDPSLK